MLSATYDHALTLFGDRSQFSSVVGGFVAAGLKINQPAIMFTTASHRDDVVRHLVEHAVNVDDAARRGLLTMLDANETLDRLMRKGMPDAQAFSRAIPPIIDRTVARTRQPFVRAYGEMVDVLLEHVGAAATLRLEQLWNGYAPKFSFKLLCGYSTQRFTEDPPRLEKVCQAHTRVLSYSEPAERLAGLRRRW